MPGAFCCGLGRKWRPLTPSSDDQQRGIESLFATHVVELIMSINEDCILIYKFYCWSSINSNLPVDRTPLCVFQSLRTNLVGVHHLLAWASRHSMQCLAAYSWQKGEILIALPSDNALPHLWHRGASATSPSRAHARLLFTCSQPKALFMLPFLRGVCHCSRPAPP